MGTPRSERIHKRISHLERQLEDVFVRSKSGNPYPKCSGCGITNVEFSIRGDNHFQTCGYQALTKRLLYYRSLLVRCDIHPDCRKSPALAEACVENRGLDLPPRYETL